MIAYIVSGLQEISQLVYHRPPPQELGSISSSFQVSIVQLHAAAACFCLLLLLLLLLLLFVASIAALLLVLLLVAAVALSVLRFYTGFHL